MRPKFLLTNDDGIDAPGLSALERALDGLGTRTVIAPAEEHSGASHRATTRLPVELEEIAPNRLAIGGTPVDCVRIGVRYIAPDTSWVISGINRGGNLGVDTFMSGTVAAAREAALLGLPAIAISQLVGRGREPDWEVTVERAAFVIRELMKLTLDAGSFWNVNLPHPERDDDPLDLVFCPADVSSLDIRYEREGNRFLWCGDYHARPHVPGSDVAVCFSGKVAVTKIPLALPHP